MAKKDASFWKSKLSDLKGAVVNPRNPHDTVVQTASPSFNFMFGHSWGLPLGFSLMLYGLPKSGKSLLSYLMAGGVHRDYNDGMVIKFNTEFREEGQLTPEWAKMYGMDWDRYIGINTNRPDEIYDQIEKDVAAWCQEGMPLKLVIIDSMNGIQGRRGMDSESILKTQIGDVALTNKEGLKRILPIQRKYGFGIVMTSHVAIEMDPLEQKRHGKYRSGASVGVQHSCEYTAYVEKAQNKADRADMLGQEFVDQNAASLDEKNKDTLAHKIYFKMADSTMGPKLRDGELTFDYGRGVINQHEEVFKLAVNRGAVERPNNTSYVVGQNKWVGKPAFLKALKDSPELQEELMKILRTRDVSGQMSQYDAQAARAEESPE